MRARFGLVLRLNPYDVPELTKIVNRSAGLLSVEVSQKAAEEIARRSRGTPRISNRLLRRVRDFALVRASGHVDEDVALAALDLLEVDRFGLDEIDRKIMLTILEKYGGGPVGIGTIAASIDEESGTIEEVYEPYLMQLGFIERTPRGRVATDRAFDYFQVARRRFVTGVGGQQDSLF
jgi:Holliday junction DNA helicase RuvB